MGAAQSMATEAENFLGGGFAGAAGDSQNFRVAARARGGAKVTLEVLAEGNPNARKLYEDEGFEFHSACGLPRGTVARQPRRMRTLPPERSGVWREDPLRAVSLRHRAALPPAAPAQRPRTMACLLLAPSCA